MKISTAGLNLIKEFEGCELTSYKCPAGIWTIGYGHTGPDVKPGMTITQARADELLAQDLVRFEQAVDRLIEPTQQQCQFDAIVSFTFNVGEGALEGSTLRRRMNAGEDLNTVAREELPKWVKGAGNEPLPGLVRRRDAEVALHCSGTGSTPAPAPTVREVTATANRETVIKKRPVPSSELADNEKTTVPAGKVYAKARVLGAEAGHTLLDLPFGAGQFWLFDDHWSGLAAAPATGGSARLSVPYQSQRDNYRDANRTCFSSSCAMLLMFLKPGVISSDDDYIREVFKRGDSTDPTVQVATLAHFGLPVTYHQNGTVEGLKAQIRAGKPVPIGILHHGPATAPSGGGHWICVIGFRDDANKPGGGTFICHDPWGELDNASGEYVSTNGNAMEYSYKMISQRYTVANPQDGWHIKA